MQPPISDTCRSSLTGSNVAAGHGGASRNMPADERWFVPHATSAQPSRHEPGFCSPSVMEPSKAFAVTTSRKRPVVGDPLAVESFEYIAGWLGRGLAVLTAVLDPGCFVLGGGVAEAGEVLLAPTRAAYQRFLPAGAHRSPPRLKLAELGNDAGLIGAADLARMDLDHPLHLS